MQGKVDAEAGGGPGGLRLLPFQRTFQRAALDSAFDVAAMSGPRSLGKTYLAGRILARCLTPGDPIHVPGADYILIAASLEQARLTLGFVRPVLEPLGGFSFLDSAQRIAYRHRPTGTRLRVLSSDGKTAMGIVNTRLVVLDEPGAFDVRKGELMADALFGALGKVGSPLKLIMVGTLAPKATGPGHWWHDLIAAGTVDTTHVTAFRGNRKRWDQWNEIRRCNPLAAVDAKFRAKLLQERDAARRDPRLKARFLSYRLNVPTAEESAVLLTVDDWTDTTARRVPEPEGRPVVGVDLGAGRAWSAAVALWRNGRTEAVAVAPGVPSIADQERRDRVNRGTYQRLIDNGTLTVADGLKVPPPSLLLDRIRPWGPEFVTCDRFRFDELMDHAKRLIVVPRVTRWSEAAQDIRALRKMAADGPLSVERGSRSILQASLSVATVQNDDSGNSRILKRGDNAARDDVAAAMTLAAGAVSRLPAVSRGVYHGTV